MDTRTKANQIVQQYLEQEKASQVDADSLHAILDLLLSTIEKIPDGPEKEKQTLKLAEEMISRRNLLSLLRQQAAELDALKRISRTLTFSLELNQVLDGVVTEAMRLIKNANDAHIFLYHDDALSFGAALDHTGKRGRTFTEPRPEGLTYSVACQKKTIIMEDQANHPLFADTPADWQGSIVGIPLMMGTRVVGVMNLARSTVGGFSDSELRLLSLLADQAAIAIVNARLHRSTSQQARSDMLTGLPNRRALDEQLESEIKRAQLSGKQLAVIMMDLDGFKIINDSFGHSTGDQVLRQIFRQLATGIRSADFLARYGGDELTLILPDTDVAGANLVAQKLGGKFNEIDVRLPDGSRVEMGLSGGIALYPRHGQLASELMRAADEALYRAKRHARGTFQVARQPTGQLPQIN